MDKNKADQKSKAKSPNNEKSASNSNQISAKELEKSSKSNSNANLPGGKDSIKNTNANTKDVNGKQSPKSPKDSPVKEPAGKQHASKSVDERYKKPVVEQPVKPPYLTYPVNVSEFHQKYDKFLAEDKENKQKQAKYLGEFLENSGLEMAFRLICAEIISHEIDRDEALDYAAKRLKELGAHLAKLNNPAELTNSKAAGSKTQDPRGKDQNSSQAQSTANTKR